MSEVEQQQSVPESVETPVNGAPERPAKDGKAGLVAAGVTAALLGGAAAAVAVARGRESQSYSRLQAERLGGGGARAAAGSRERAFPEITVPQMLRRTVDRLDQHPALVERVGKQWVTTTYAQLWERVMNFALGLAELGVRAGDRVAILSENRIEWAITDLAALSLGAATVPLYATLPPAQVQHILADSGARVVVTENPRQLQKVLEVRDHLPELQHVLLVEPKGAVPEGVATFAAVEAIPAGGADREREFERRWHAVQPHDLASIIYTSGTTGLPKGAMLTHDNFLSNAQSVPLVVPIGPDDVFLSFLPLAHVFERMVGHYLPLLLGATVYYSEGLRHLPRNMAEVEPTIMASVPRLYESIHARVEEEMAKRSPAEQKLFRWALEVGTRHNGQLALGQAPGLVTRAEYALADKLVLGKLRKKVAGSRLRAFISGGAPLGNDTARFFSAVGWRILQGYGLTETSPVITVNRPELNKIGTVGAPMPGVEVKIAEDGEILSRGPNTMQGYFNLPEATAEAIDEEGWFHTGDIGELDGDGYLRITDRKKDILVLANGKNVAPQPIESALKQSPFIGWAALYGDKQPVVVALIVPAFGRLKSWAEERGLPAEPLRELLDRPEVRQLYKAEIDAHQKDRADYEKVRRFALLDRDFTIDGGELTPTLKVKRRHIAEQYADTIAKLYSGGGE